jgi:hypothetical protein
MQKNVPVHTMCIRDVERKIYAFLTSELSDFSTEEESLVQSGQKAGCDLMPS